MGNHASQAVGTTPKTGFRNDINALRAIAAMSVVLFHFDIPGFSGGFVGVDVFFVISGLLMTRIIASGIDKGAFSVWGFYADRVRRIVPALYIVCAALMLFGLLALDPWQLADMAGNVVATMLFYSNMHYAAQSGYFAEASDANWLLHTWTLSVEWQFYLLYPLLMLLLSRIAWLWQRRAAVIGVGCAVAFIATLVIAGYSSSFQQYAFFMLPTRAWEMLAGGWLALGGPRALERGQGRALGGLGLAAILLSILAFNGAMAWPSAMMLITVGGTVAVLAADQRDSLWMRTRVVQTLGLWSYSIYLWHWPFVVALGYFGLGHSWPARIGAVAATMVCAALSYHLVETRLRIRLFGSGRETSRRGWAVAASVGIVLIGVPLAIGAAGGLEGRRLAALPEAARSQATDFRAAADDWQGMSPCKGGERFSTGRLCVLGKGNPTRIAILGDSHVEQMAPRLKQIASRGQYEITILRQQGCPPLPDVRWTRLGDQCGAFTNHALSWMGKQRFDRVLILSAWEIYLPLVDGAIDPQRLCVPDWRGCMPLAPTSGADAVVRVKAGFVTLASDLRRTFPKTTQLVVLLPSPSPGQLTPARLYHDVLSGGSSIPVAAIGRQEWERRTAFVNQQLRMLAAQAGALIIDPADWQCDADQCPTQVDRHYLFKDTHHLRGSMVGLPLFDWLDQALAGQVGRDEAKRVRDDPSSQADADVAAHTNPA